MASLITDPDESDKSASADVPGGAGEAHEVGWRARRATSAASVVLRLVQRFHARRPGAFSVDWIRERLGITDPQEDDPRIGIFKVAPNADSMDPTIPPGSLLLAHMGPQGGGYEGDDVKEGKIYVVAPPDEKGLQVKRARIQNKALLWLWSDNSRHAPKAYPIEDRDVREIVKGRVRWVSHEEE